MGNDTGFLCINQAAFRQSRLTSYEVHREVRERRARSGTHPLMRVVNILLVAALLDLVGAGQVLSSMRQPGRVRTTERGAVGSGEDTLESFRHCVQRLRATPNAALSLRAVLGYIERASAHPRSRICMWDPEFCTHVAPTPEARECLLAAGFVALETNDASSTPYLAQRRVPPRVLRAMALELKRQSAALEAGGGGGGGAPPAPPPNASSALAKPQSEKRAKPTSADAALRREAERLGTGAPTAVKEAEQVEQIMGMISGIIKELERQVCSTQPRRTPHATWPHATSPHATSPHATSPPPHHTPLRHTPHVATRRHTSPHHTPPRHTRTHARGCPAPMDETRCSWQVPGGTLRNETDGALLAGGEDNSTAAESQAPVHFRIYRSPSFPGFPPGGGLPFMPGGGGGGGDSEEDGDVPSLERKLKAAELPAEAEEVAHHAHCTRTARAPCALHAHCTPTAHRWRSAT